MARWSVAIALLAWFVLVTCTSMPLCDRGMDTFGQWVKTADIESMPDYGMFWNDHFLGGGAGEARNFSKVWIPNSCAVHRFTAKSVQAMVSSIRAKRNQTEPLRVIFLGDSGTRGVFCGITRILSGSEIVGPCENAVCGTQGTMPMSHKKTHAQEDVNFGPDLVFSFMYVKSLTDRYTNWMVEGNIIKKPYAVVLNTGAWDFDHTARARNYAPATPECGFNQTEDFKVSNLRVSPSIVANMKEFGELAQNQGVKAIYRNSHFNYRYGALCADAKLEAAVQNTSWEVWDNRRMSRDVWKTETYDGFHFDRHRVHTVEHHQNLIALNKEMGKDIPGALEIQLAQSLLFHLFHDEIQNYVDTNP